MSGSNDRVSLNEATDMIRAAQSAHLFQDCRSAILHDLSRLRQRFGALCDAFPPDTLHAVAIKANPVLEILKALVLEGAGLEAASREEVHLALAAGCPPEQIVFDSPAKTAEEIDEALRLGLYLNVDNLDELSRVADSDFRQDSQSRVGLRINPLVGGGAIAHTSVARSDSKFGLQLSECRSAIFEAFRSYEWLCGLHVHVGSQGCSLELLCEAVDRAAQTRQEIQRETGNPVSFLDIGGGLPAAYETGDTVPTYREYAERLQQSSPELFTSPQRLITEFGRSLHAGCGVAVSRVEYTRPSQRMATLHFGADLLLRPVYCPEDWKHEFFVLNPDGSPKDGEWSRVTLAGPLCFGGDVIARDILLPPIDSGDWVVIRDIGAYTVSMWSRHCSRGIPMIIGYDPPASDPVRILRHAEQPSDIVKFWSQDGSGR